MRHVLDPFSFLFLIQSKVFLFSSYFLNSACLCFLNVSSFLPDFSLMFLIDMFLIKNACTSEVVLNFLA